MYKMIVQYSVLLLLFTTFVAEGNSRQKRQFSIGLPRPQNNNGQPQTIQGALNGFLGGLFGQQNRPVNQGQNSHPGQAPGQNFNPGHRPGQNFNPGHRPGQNFNPGHNNHGHGPGHNHGHRPGHGHGHRPGQNHGHNNHGNRPGQPIVIDPIAIFNQFATGFNQQNCNTNNGGCEQGCLMRRGRRQCYCEKGFILRNDQKTCQDIDECRTIGQRPCQDKCTNTNGSFRCSCSAGAVLLSDGKSCGPATVSCNDNNGGCQQVCNPQRNGVKCGCINGFDLAPDKRSCVDIDECASGTHNCPQNQICANIEGGFECNVDTTRETCAVNKGGCQHKCEEQRGSIKCSCRNNFRLNQDKKTCSKVEVGQTSCDVNNGGCEQKCRFRNDKVKCSCKRGFTLKQDKKTCYQSPDCNVNNGGCEHLCRTNRNGRTRCACRQGFTLREDSMSCASNGGSPPKPSDPCRVNNGGCEHICSLNNGIVKCLCRPGFDFVGRKCQRPTTQKPVVIFPPGPTQGTTLSPPTECGVNTKKSTFRTRIVGGQPADPKDWPWMAALLRKVGKTQFCGGTLFTDKHVLSAAHCVYTFRPSDIYVRLGEYDFATPDENNPTDFRVNDIKVHEKYDSRTQENDIAILKLERSSSFSEFIWPACLPPAGESFADQRGYVTGWGTIDFGGPSSTRLLEVVLPIWRQDECVRSYPDNVVAETMMCAGVRSGGKDSCQGDSGGPFLVQLLPSSRWYVAGVVSWGKECAKAGNPGVYTRVNRYLDWIKTHTN